MTPPGPGQRPQRIVALAPQADGRRVLLLVWAAFIVFVLIWTVVRAVGHHVGDTITGSIVFVVAVVGLAVYSRKQRAGQSSAELGPAAARLAQTLTPGRSAAQLLYRDVPRLAAQLDFDASGLQWSTAGDPTWRLSWTDVVAVRVRIGTEMLLPMITVDVAPATPETISAHPELAEYVQQVDGTATICVSQPYAPGAETDVQRGVLTYAPDRWRGVRSTERVDQFVDWGHGASWLERKVTGQEPPPPPIAR